MRKGHRPQRQLALRLRSKGIGKAIGIPYGEYQAFGPLVHPLLELFGKAIARVGFTPFVQEHEQIPRLQGL